MSDQDPAYSTADANPDPGMLQQMPFTPGNLAAIDPGILVQPIPNASPPANPPTSGMDRRWATPLDRIVGTRGDPRGLIPYIRSTAEKYGINPDVAVRVARSEGLGQFLGDQGRSGGAFQLYTGGGIGNQFERDTGLNPLDPRNERATIDYALRTARRVGWGPWHGARRIGITGYDGINQPAVPQQYIPNPYPPQPSEYGRPDNILKTAQDYPGVVNSPYMPQPGASTGILTQALQAMSRYGITGAVPTMRFLAAYIGAARRGQVEAARLYKEQHEEAFKELLESNSKDLQGIGYCYDEYQPKGDWDGFQTCIASNGGNLTNNRELQKAISDRNWGEVKQFSDAVHKNWLTAAKVGSQRSKAAGTPPDESSFGYPSPDETAPSAAPAPSTTTPAPSPATPAPTATPPDSGLTARDQVPTDPNAPPAIKAIPEDVKQMGRDMQIGGASYKLPEKTAPQAITQSNAYDAYLNDQMNKAWQTLSGQQLIDRINQLNPAVVGLMQRIKDGKDQLPARGTSGQAFRALMDNLMTKAYGNGWGGLYQARQDSINDYRPNGHAGQALYAAGRLGSSSAELLNALKAIPPNDIPLKNGYSKWLSKTVTTDPRWAAVYEAAYDFITQSVILQRNGRSAHADVSARMQAVMDTGVPGQIRAGLKVAAGNDMGSIDTLLKTWNNLDTGRQYPYTFNADAANVTNTVATRLDAPSGYFLGNQPVPSALAAGEPGARTTTPGSVPAPPNVKEGQTIKTPDGRRWIIRGQDAIPIQ